VIKTGNKEPSKSMSWKVLETVMSHLKLALQTIALMRDDVTRFGVNFKSRLGSDEN